MTRSAGFVIAFLIVAQFHAYAADQQSQAAQVAPAATAGRTVEAPTFTVGEWWEYVRPNRPERESKFKLTVTEKTGELVTMVNRRGDKFVFTKDGNEVERPEGGPRARYEPYLPRLEFPLQEGKRWTKLYRVLRERAPGRPFEATLQGKVGGWERVSIPGGTFDAIRIELSIEERHPKAPARGHEEVCWYAPEVKRFIKCTYSETRKGDDFELVSYQLK